MAANRILYVNGGILDRGGITAYMMNYYRHFDRERIQVDFVAHGGRGPMDDEIETLGGRVYHVPTKRESPLGNLRGLMDVMNPSKYRLVHSHMDGMNAYVLAIAKAMGVPVRISHSHNTSHLDGGMTGVLHSSLMRGIPLVATDLWACSIDAGEWLYGKRVRFRVVPNAIQEELYSFSDGKRTEMRKSLGVGDSFVIGCVGRVERRKNQLFLIHLMPRLLETVPDAMLLIIGAGNEDGGCREATAAIGVEDRVRFLGERDDVKDLLNALDLLVMPSLFEGFGLSLLEAQANGLPCIASDNVPREVDATGQVEFIPLEADAWIRGIAQGRGRSTDSQEKIRAKGYGISAAAGALQRRYLRMLERSR